MQPNVLIVDDEKAILFAMAEFFTTCGYVADCARDKQEAETRLAQCSYSVLITDLRLSGSEDTDGIEIAQYAIQRNPSVRTILLTAYGTPELERLAYDRGVSVCLSKPKPLGEIVETVARLLEDAQREATANHCAML